jgi:hypothetical protein
MGGGRSRMQGVSWGLPVEAPSGGGPGGKPVEADESLHVKGVFSII